MDVNGLRVWQVADAAGFGLASTTPPAAVARDLHWRADARLLRLDRQQPAPALVEDAALARALALKPSPVRDLGGSYAWWSPTAGKVLAGGFGAGSTPLDIPADIPVGVAQPTDMAFGPDDILYLARNDGVVLVDRRDRWAPARAAADGFHAHRLAPAAAGGAWVLDRAAGRLAHLTGVPLRVAGFRPQPADQFRPVEPNPRPPRLRVLRGARLPADVEAIAIAASPGGEVAVLGWRAGDDALVFTLEDRKLVRRFALQGLRFPYGLAWMGEDRLALLVTDHGAPAAQAFVYELEAAILPDATARPMGDIHRLLNPWRGGFTNSLAPVPSYPTAGSSADEPGGVQPLRALSRATYARSGRVTLGPFNSGVLGCVWHRLYVEASVPDHAGVRVWAHADDIGGRPAAPGEAGAPDWAPHLVGQTAAEGQAADAPRAAWCAERSEIAFHPGLSACASAPDRSGLFTAALQHAGRRVRRLEGRYLWLHLELLGDSQVTPEVAGLRVYGARFSYRDRYLPALYREELAGPDADAAGPATAPDFLERLLTLFEGSLTQLEGKIAGGWLLTDPAATPAEALPWLARWIGVEGGAGEAPARLRQALRAAPWTARLHGTVGGLMAELELATGGVLVDGGRVDAFRDVPRPGQLALATLNEAVVRALVMSVSGGRDAGEVAVLAGGAVTRGEIVVLEGYRLRRTFATILGADLAEEDDPLTLGLATSGNSFVGDTLFLGDEARREFMALFAADLPRSASDRAAVADFFERLAHRTLVLVRDTPRTGDLERLRVVARAAAPAHVEVTVLPASRPLIVGAASLVGLDTFLIETPPIERVRVGRTRIGVGDQIRGEGRLDPRADGPVSAKPTAVVDGPLEVWSGTGFVLSSARSSAAVGRTIDRGIWIWD